MPGSSMYLTHAIGASPCLCQCLNQWISRTRTSTIRHCRKRRPKTPRPALDCLARPPPLATHPAKRQRKKRSRRMPPMLGMKTSRTKAVGSCLIRLTNCLAQPWQKRRPRLHGCPLKPRVVAVRMPSSQPWRALRARINNKQGLCECLHRLFPHAARKPNCSMT